MNRLGEHTQHVGHLNDAPFIATRDSKGCLHNVPVVMLQLEEGLIGAPGWRSRLSVRLQPGHDLAVREFEPRIRLWADGSEPGACLRFCVSLSLCPSPIHALSLSVPKINKKTLEEEGLIHGLIFSFVPPKYVQTKQHFLSFPWGYDSLNSFLSAHSFPLSLVLRLPRAPPPVAPSAALGLGNPFPPVFQEAKLASNASSPHSPLPHETTSGPLSIRRSVGLGC